MALTREQENILILGTLSMVMLEPSNPETLNRLTVKNKQELAIIIKRMLKEGLVTTTTAYLEDYEGSDEEVPDIMPTRILATEKGMQLLDRSG